MSRKRYGSTSTWIFFTETIFLTNFERFLNTKRADHFFFALFPLFIGEKREVVIAQLAQVSRVASTRRHRLLLEPLGRPKRVWLLFAPLFSLNTPPFVFFYWFLSEKLWNFMDYITTPIFFPECYKTLRITQQCLLSFQNVVKLYGLHNDACFRGFRRKQTRFKDQP